MNGRKYLLVKRGTAHHRRRISPSAARTCIVSYQIAVGRPFVEKRKTSKLAQTRGKEETEGNVFFKLRLLGRAFGAARRCWRNPASPLWAVLSSRGVD